MGRGGPDQEGKSLVIRLEGELEKSLWYTVMAIKRGSPWQLRGELW